MLLSYVFLFLALIAGSVKGYCSKITSNKVSTVKNISLMHALRMFLCIVIGSLFVLISSGFSGFVLEDTKSLLVCLFSGFSTSFFIITWVLSVKKSAFAMLDVFLILSTLIPIVLSKIFWNVDISLMQIVGFSILLFAVIFMFVYNNKVKSRMTIKDIAVLILCACFNGCTEFAQKLRIYTCFNSLSAYTFSFYTYLFSFLILALVIILTGLKDKKEEDEKLEVKSVFWWVVVLSVCLFLHTLFNSLIVDLSPSVQYPLSHGLGLVIAMLLGHFCYDEKINKYSLIGIALAIVSFVCMVL